MADTDRGAMIEIGGEPHRLILTTMATKAIAAKYGDLEKLGERLLNTENFVPALSEIVWLITLLANQPIMIHNLRHPDAPHALLTEEAVDLLTTPFELAAYKDAITEAMFNGARRDVQSEEEPGSKNSPAE